MKIYQGMKNLWMLAAALLVGSVALRAQNQGQQTPEQREKQRMEYIDTQVKRLVDQLDLEYWQEFYVDSTLTHDLIAMEEELTELQKTKVGNSDLYQNLLHRGTVEEILENHRPAEPKSPRQTQGQGGKSDRRAQKRGKIVIFAGF